MSNGTKSNTFRWDKKRRQAAQLLAENELTDIEISQEVGINRKTLYQWKKFKEFNDHVDDIAKELGELYRRQSIGLRARRLASLQRRWEKMHNVIDERGESSDMQEVAGGKTGLLVKQYKAVGKQMFEEYKVDTGLLKELREHEKQAAQELGQFVEKIAPTTPDGANPYDGTISDTERLARIVALLNAARNRGVGPSSDSEESASSSEPD